MQPVIPVNELKTNKKLLSFGKWMGKIYSDHDIKKVEYIIDIINTILLRQTQQLSQPSIVHGTNLPCRIHGTRILSY